MAKKSKRRRWVRLLRGTTYAAELRAAMHGRSGVYAVRDVATKTVAYVGESHTGRAWKTMLRHFQDPTGKFEARGEWVHHRPEIVEILWQETTDTGAMPLELVWIQEFKPSANLAGYSDDEANEEAPF